MGEGAIAGTRRNGRIWRRVTLAWVVLVAGCLVGTSCGGNVAVGTKALRLKACTIDGLAAYCGTAMVPEDRLTGTGPRIPVRVVVFPASSPHRMADPIVWVAGGPGDSAVDWIPLVKPLFFFNTHRALIFIDQRGTGGAGGLTCPSFSSTVPDLSHKAALRASVDKCVARLKANLAFYTTAMAADDLHEVLGDLGYTRVNVVGISYGTTLAQVFLLRHPSMVRTMTLLSGTLLSVPILERFPQSGQDALDTVIAECAHDIACHRAFPNLSSDWSALWNSLLKGPIVVRASISPNHQTEMFSADSVAAGLHQLLAEPNTEAAVPIIIHTLGTAQNRGAAIVAVAKALAKARVVLGPGSTQEMIKYPIECSEGWARNQASGLVGRASFEYHLDLLTAQWWHYVCTLIPRPAPAALYGAQRASPVPVLALNGLADPQDPPSNMAGAREFWPNSLELAVPGQAHDINWQTWQSCTGPLVGEFIARGTVSDLDTSCVAKAHGQPFALTLKTIAPGY